ncbi:desmocollin 2-like protein isoform X1 [Labrus bergylta]|uniref:Desmocollin 2 like n=1 Tax=Labrus bergylta TaxID=56723 RepID=A0A3Q3FY53_9LABR|nr:desmocollin-2-like [Labrus bergylta]
MANVLIFNIFLVLILSGVESCYIPSTLDVYVPHTISAGQYITTVEFPDCDSKSIQLTVYDQSLRIYSNGTVEAAATLSVATAGRIFYVYVEDNSGQQRMVAVRLLDSTMQGKKQTDQVFLRRFKRRWSPPPFNILENDDGPYPKEIEKIVSDSASDQQVYYTFTGPGVDLPPVGVFSLNPNTGMLSVHKKVDREMYPKFVITTRVFNRFTNQETDFPLDIEILVDDVNDNAPEFKDRLDFTVPEKSKIGSIVGMVNATDRDQERTLHVKIKYTLLTDLDQFAINPVSGVITTKTNTLNREVKDKYKVIVKIQDMNGADNGLSTTGTATISLTDVNDNPPTFTKSSYPASVTENESEKLILRIPVEDKDLVNTPNWISKFLITKGNEKGNFRIDTDPKTNEGLLFVTKPLDYEKSPKVDLEIMARNVPDLQGTTATWQSIPVNVAVKNVDEGPEFTAPTVRYNVKENTPNGTLIGTYTALDPETKSSNGIKYFKGADPASWITMNKDNGELRVANTIDRESHFVKNGEYSIMVTAVDASNKKGTGKVIIVVEDDNDNKPTLPTGELVLCEKEGEMGSVLVTAEDKDQPPFSSPFTFSLPQNSDGKWHLTRYNDTAATLKHLKDLPTGIHNVPVEVKDLQGFGETQIAKVRICQCKNGVCLAKQSSVSFGPLAILTLLLPLALLLLLCLLLAFFCATKREKMELEDVGDSGGILLKSNTEAPGEEVDASLINVPTFVNDAAVKGSVKGLNAGWQGTTSNSNMGGMSTQDIGMYTSGVKTNEFYSGQYDSQYGSQHNGGQLLGSGVGFDNRFVAQDSSLLQTWQTNGRYLQQKLPYLGREDDGRYAEDIIHSYGYEGAGSQAGSVGCCSDYGDNDNLDFINTLGPKFKSLAEVCNKT